MARAGVENETEWTLAIDAHRSPDASDPVPQRGSHVHRLGRFDHDFGQPLFGGRGESTCFNGSRRGWSCWRSRSQDLGDRSAEGAGSDVGGIGARAERSDYEECHCERARAIAHTILPSLSRRHCVNGLQ